MISYPKIHDVVRAAFLIEVKSEDLVRSDLHESAADRVAIRAASVLGLNGWKSDTPMVAAAPINLEQRLYTKLTEIREELGRLKGAYATSVSLRCYSLNDQCDLLEDILGVPRSHPRATQADR